MSRLPLLLALLLPLLLIGLLAPARAEDPGQPPPLSDLYRRVARLDVPVEEISGMTALPGAPERERHFLVVSDEGGYDAETDHVKGSFFRVRLAWGEDDKVTVAGVDPVVAHGDYLACNSFDIMDRVREIKIPTLIITGSADLMTPSKYGQYLHDQISDAQWIDIKDGGHMMAVEKPAQVSQAVARFLEVL